MQAGIVGDIGSALMARGLSWVFLLWQMVEWKRSLGMGRYLESQEESPFCPRTSLRLQCVERFPAYLLR